MVPRRRLEWCWMVEGMAQFEEGDWQGAGRIVIPVTRYHRPPRDLRKAET